MANSEELTRNEQYALRYYVHSPEESTAALEKLGQKIYGTRGVSSGSKAIDQIMIPTRGPWVRVWTAPPGGGKSSMLRIVAKTEAERLVKDGEHDRYVAHITYEEAVDGQEIYYQRDKEYTNEDFWRGKVPPKLVKQGGINRSRLPIWWFGESMMKSDGLSMPPMTIGMCIAGMRGLYKSSGKLPSLIVVDYAQEIETDLEGNNRTLSVIQGMKDVIRMATLTGCAIEIGSQAVMTVLDKKVPIPAPNDTEWSRFIHQKATNHLGLWRAWTTHANDLEAQIHGIQVNDNDYFPLTPNLMVARSLKHRPGVLRKDIAFEMNPDRLEIRDFPEMLGEKSAADQSKSPFQP